MYIQKKKQKTFSYEKYIYIFAIYCDNICM